MPVYRTDEQLEELGRNFLRRIGLEDQVRPDGMTVIQKIKRLDPAFQYRRVPDQDMRDAEARWDSDHCEVSMRESVFTGMQHGDAHPRFIVFHEISHYVLGHQGTRNRGIEKIRGYSVGNIRHQETEASRLAVILMAPEHLVPENASAEEISQQFSMGLNCGYPPQRGSRPYPATPPW